jgi:hypothetical protein
MSQTREQEGNLKSFNTKALTAKTRKGKESKITEEELPNAINIEETKE